MEIQKKKRKALRTQATRLVGEAEALMKSAAPNAEDLEVHIERLLLTQRQLNEVDATIEPLIPEQEADAEFATVIEYGDKVLAWLTRLRSAAKRSTEATNVGHTNSNEDRARTTGTTAKIKLPKLELLKFNGERRNWQPFWELLKTAIHKNSDLTPAEKFQYLRSALTGDGAPVIDGLQPTSECYSHAIDILTQRFANQAVLIQDHMEGLMAMGQVSLVGNARALRRWYDGLQAHIRGLKALGVGEESYCAMLYPLVLRALPKDLSLVYNTMMALKDAEDGSNDDTSNTDASSGTGTDSVHKKELSALLNFLRIEIESRERTSGEQPDDATGKPRFRNLRHDQTKGTLQQVKPRPSSAAALHGSVIDKECFSCNSKPHASENCTAAKDLAEKKLVLREHGQCFRCTKPNHTARMCRTKICCSKCRGKHATAMCDPDFVPNRRDAQLCETPRGTHERVVPVSLQATQCGPTPVVLLQTVAAWAESQRRRKLARIMFDTGSQRSFITEQLSKELNCRLLGTEILTVGVFGGNIQERTFRRVRVTLRSRKNERSYEIDALETPTICEQDIPSPDENILASLDDLGCSLGDDINGLDHRNIDILIGSGHYWGAVTGKIRRLDGSLTAIETMFGWAVQGRDSSCSVIVICSQAIMLRATVQEKDPTAVLRQFWELESLGIIDQSTENPSENEVMQRFEPSITRTDGRYEVGLPCRSNVNLAGNEDLARRRLDNLRKKLVKNPDLMLKYDEAIRLYQNHGLAEKFCQETGTKDPQRVYYMPHQAVLRDESTTTKLRVVFDASSRGCNQTSLNDNLESGPNLNPDLVPILLNFRANRVALVADVEKAFLQNGVKEEDRHALRFFWFKEPPQPNQPVPEVETWRMTRVTFGTTSSPFLLAATLQHHCNAMESAHPVTAKKLKRSVYVDDLLTGAASEDEAKELYQEANLIFEKGGMRLHKWGSNSRGLREMFEEQGRGERPLGQMMGVLKVLGIMWKPGNDSLTFSPDHVVEFAKTRTDTKRFVLQTTARLDDPLGFLSPFIVRAKILFQEIWKLNLRWDDVLPDELIDME